MTSSVFPSDHSLERSVLTNSTAASRPKDAPSAEVQPISPLPFLVCPFYSPHEEFLRFLPGAFRRQGDVLGQGATFSVEKHILSDIGRGMIDDLVSGSRLSARWPVVAVKRLRSQARISWKTFEMIERELIALKVLRGAPHVVQLIGLGWEIAPVNGDSRLWPTLVLEYAQRIPDMAACACRVLGRLSKRLLG
jgi:hypothetical protein